jgi:hypothetical protein
MARRNPYVMAPAWAEEREFSGRNYKVIVKARFFPTTGIEYHVEIVRCAPNLKLKISVRCELRGGATESLKLNEATTADIYINGNDISFERIPQIGRNVGFVSCGVEQITAIREVRIVLVHFEPISI